MILKKLTIAAIMMFAFFAASNNSYSQGGYNGEVTVKLPEINIGGGYDEYGYDSEGYDKYGYNRDGYDRNGYNREGYDKAGYDRNGFDKYGYDRKGYDKYGNQRDATVGKKKKHSDNGNHYGWYKDKKKKKNKHKKHDRDDD